MYKFLAISGLILLVIGTLGCERVEKIVTPTEEQKNA